MKTLIPMFFKMCTIICAVDASNGNGDITTELPINFDSREHWSECPSIGHIYDQGKCGTCWAVSTVSAFTDRICIQSQGRITALRSSQQVISCCKKCSRRGCTGSYDLHQTWLYLKNTGVVTGGDYMSDEGCQPYQIKPCAIRKGVHPEGEKLPRCYYWPWRRTPKCQPECYNSKYSTRFDEDKVRVKGFYYMHDDRVAQLELFRNGPIIMFTKINTDFFELKSGVYQYRKGRRVNSHVMRVIGWGVENGVNYWLVANSWNTGWGENGIGKIIRSEESNRQFGRYFSAATVDL